MERFRARWGRRAPTLIIILLGLTSPGSARAADASAPKTNRTARIAWVDEVGRVRPLSGQVQSRWTWGRASPGDPVDSPILRTWIELAPGHRLLKWTDLAIRRDAEIKDSPFRAPRGQVLSIDTTTSNLRSRVQVQGPDGKVIETGLVITISVDQPMQWIDPSCGKKHIEIYPTQGSAKYLYNAVICQEKPDSIDMYLLSSADVSLDDRKFPGRQGGGANWSLHRIKKPSPLDSKTRPLGTYELKEKDTTNVMTFNVMFKPLEIFGKRNFFSFSVGTSLVLYQELRNVEEVADTKLNQVGITLKLSYDHIFGESPWSLGANTYVTALPLYASGASSGIRFLGVNGKVGFAPPWLKKPWRLSLSGGWYYTSTFVSADTEYGFVNMSGPQLFPSLRYQLRGGNMLATYFKFSPILSAGKLTFESREIATGLAWIHPISLGRTISVSLDMSRLSLVIPNKDEDGADLGSDTNISSTSISLSFGYGF